MSHELIQADSDQMYVLLRQYKDTLMDLADASLATVAESLNISCIFTIDHR